MQLHLKCRIRWGEMSENEYKVLLEKQYEYGRLPRLAFTMKETSEILGISYISVHRLIQRGLLKNSSASRHKLISLKEIERFRGDTAK